MNKKSNTIISISLAIMFAGSSCFAQLDNSDSLRNKLGYSVSYYGNNIWNPGLAFGLEYPVFEKEKSFVNKKGKAKFKKRSILLSGKLAAYWDPQNHVGLINYYGINFRRTNMKRKFINAGISPLSYYRSFLSETYEVDNNGKVERVFLPGRSYYAPTISLGLGRSKSDKKLHTWFLNMNWSFLMDYNSGVVPFLFIEYGYIF